MVCSNASRPALQDENPSMVLKPPINSYLLIDLGASNTDHICVCIRIDNNSL